MHSDILDELYRQYYGAALLYVLSLCRDRALAEELVHDAFVKAYLSLPDDAPSFHADNLGGRHSWMRCVA